MFFLITDLAAIPVLVLHGRDRLLLVSYIYPWDWHQAEGECLCPPLARRAGRRERRCLERVWRSHGRAASARAAPGAPHSPGGRGAARPGTPRGRHSPRFPSVPPRISWLTSFITWQPSGWWAALGAAITCGLELWWCSCTTLRISGSR